MGLTMTKWNIGEHRAALGEATRRSIEAYFEGNPFATQIECARDLGISAVTVSKHFGILRAERMERPAQERA